MFIFEKVWVRIGVMGGKQIKMFVSLGVVAAMLPLLLWGVTQAPRLTLQTRAESVQLRLWWEPAQVVIKPGQAVRLTLVAEYINQNKLIPMVKAVLKVPAGLQVEPAEINFGQAFAGRTVGGETTAVGGHAGRFELGVVEDGVFTGIPNMEVIEKKAVIIVE